MDRLKQASGAVTGFHHLTCVGSTPQSNIDFYTGVLGFRLVKRTVHFDNAKVYHFYYGDETGSVGSLLTFFPFPEPDPAVRGSGAITEIGIAVPPSSRDYWKRRLCENRVDTDFWVEEFDESVLRFRDHDGQRLKLVAAEGCEPRSFWSGGPVPGERAIRGIQSVRLGIADPEASLELLIGHLGLIESDSAGPITRLTFNGRQDRRHVEVEHLVGVERAPALPLEGVVPMAGTTNHVAFGTENEQTQLELRKRLEAAGYVLTPVKDRTYFKSIYMIEPGGVRVEVATDDCPGFAVDESVDALGTSLQLPPWLENLRLKYEQELPPIHLMLTQNPSPRPQAPCANSACPTST